MLMPPPLVVSRLRTEYLENPLGIDSDRPRLSWQVTGEGRNLRQSAYRVQVAPTRAQLEAGAGFCWDSGKVASDAISIHYGGPPVEPAQRYFWRVRVWDQVDGVSGWGDPAWWEMGLLNVQEWQAEWIEVGWDEDPQAFNPCPYFRRSFRLVGVVRSARLYITAHGLYEAWLNGERVGDQVFTPGYTPYDRMLQYQVYDVTAALHPGENVLGVILGDGWYRGTNGAIGGRNTYGQRLALLALLRVEGTAGQKIIATDASWKATTGPILKSDLKAGEVYDARLEMPGWCLPGFVDSQWQNVRVAKHSKAHLVASMSEPVRRKETFRPTILHTPKNETVLDFGQNMAGVVRFRVKGPRGTTVRLRHGEALDKDGNFTVAHLFMPGRVPDLDVHPFQQVDYTLKGEGLEEYEPRFAVHGFRYAEVDAYPGEIEPDNFTAVATYSDMRPTGTFESSDPLLNQLHRNTLWSMKSNFLDMPTDCPHRERAGWTGDVQIFTRSAAFLMDTRAFFRKWLQELTLEQFASGMVGNFVPNPYRLARAPRLSALDGSAGWGDAAVLTPMYLFQAYGDLEILERQYASMKAWVEYVRRRAQQLNWFKRFNPAYLFTRERRYRQQFIWDSNYHWGEWLEPGESEGGSLALELGILRRSLFGSPVVATAYFACSTGQLAKAAQHLGKVEEAEHYAQLAEQIRAAYAAEFIAPDGRMQPDRQASYVRALAFDLVPEALQPAVVAQLVRLIRAANQHLGTGFLSTGFICDILAEHGQLELAYELLTQRTSPSWLYAVCKGATTIWESWEGIKEDGTPTLSLNHYSPGAVVNFMHHKVAGIDAAAPGYKRIIIHPRPGGNLAWARAAYESVQGLIAAQWERQAGQMRLRVSIPANTTATVILPGAALDQVMEGHRLIGASVGVMSAHQFGHDSRVEVGSGDYDFSYSELPAA